MAELGSRTAIQREGRSSSVLEPPHLGGMRLARVGIEQLVIMDIASGSIRLGFLWRPFINDNLGNVEKLSVWRIR